MSDETERGTFVSAQRLAGLRDAIERAAMDADRAGADWASMVLRGQVRAALEPALLRAEVEPVERNVTEVPGADPDDRAVEEIVRAVESLARRHGQGQAAALAVEMIAKVLTPEAIVDGLRMVLRADEET